MWRTQSEKFTQNTSQYFTLIETKVIGLKIIEAIGLTKIPLGRQGENLARQIGFDVSDWAEEYGHGVVEAKCQEIRTAEV